MAVLDVIFPIAHVPGAVRVQIKAVPVGLVVLPLAFILITVSMPELSLATSLPVDPFALILAAVRPNLATPSLFDAVTVHIALKNSPRFGRSLLIYFMKILLSDFLS